MMGWSTFFNKLQNNW